MEQLILKAAVKYLESHPEEIEAVVGKIADLLFGKALRALEEKIGK